MTKLFSIIGDASLYFGLLILFPIIAYRMVKLKRGLFILESLSLIIGVILLINKNVVFVY